METLKYGFKNDFEPLNIKYPPTVDMDTLVICIYAQSSSSLPTEMDKGISKQVETIQNVPMSTMYVDSKLEYFIFNRARRALEPFELYQPQHEMTYTIDHGVLMFLRVEDGEYKYINILKCVESEFIDFFKIKPGEVIDAFYDLQQFYSNETITTTIPKEFIDLARINLGIKHINILELEVDYSEVESNGLTVKDNALISTCNVPSIPSTKLAIGMFVHSEFIIEHDGLQEIDVPDGVNIIKRNHGALGCLTIARAYTGWDAFNHTTKILNTFDRCSDERYIDLMIQFPPELNSKEGICKTFQGFRKYYVKEYSSDDKKDQLMMVLINPDGTFRYINLVKCKEKALLKFLGMSRFDDTRELMEYLHKRDTFKTIDTHFIFFLIKKLHETLKITDVHMYDKGCNVIPTRDKDNYKGYSTTPEKYYKNPNVGWGGTRRKRKKRKTKRKYDV